MPDTTEDCGPSLRTNIDAKHKPRPVKPSPNAECPERGARNISVAGNGFGMLRFIMPVHDWNRVTAGTFHDFHLAWIAELRRVLNRGLLPPGYYALAEQVAGEIIPDVLTLHETGSSSELSEPGEAFGSAATAGVLTVAEAAPRVSVTATTNESVTRHLFLAALMLMTPISQSVMSEKDEPWKFSRRNSPSSARKRLHPD